MHDLQTGFDHLRNLGSDPIIKVTRRVIDGDFYLIDGVYPVFFCCDSIVDYLKLPPTTKTLEICATSAQCYAHDIRPQSRIYVHCVSRTEVDVRVTWQDIALSGKISSRKHQDLLTEPAAAWIFGQLLWVRPFLSVSVIDKFPETSERA